MVQDTDQARVHEAPAPPVGQAIPAGRTLGVPAVVWRAVLQCAILAAFAGGAVMLRGMWFDNRILNPDEAELLAQALAAMRSPVPFTTWMTATTGPVWVLFLALLGALGVPLTMAMSHFIAAVLLGVLGYLGFTLARRAAGWFGSTAITLFWWLPVVLLLIGDESNFAALNSELLPAVLVIGAALVHPADLARRPWLYAVSGLLSGLAVGAKYQVAPLALALLIAQVIQVGDLRRRALLRATGWFAAAALAPAVVLLAVMLLSPDVSWVTLEHNLNFLSAYANRLTPGERLGAWRHIVTSTHLTLMLLLVCWLGARSAPRIQLCRAGFMLAGLAAVFAGGMGFSHYLYFLYAALAMAIGLPLRAQERLVPYLRSRWAGDAVVAVVAVVAWVVAFGVPELPERTQRGQLAVAFSQDGGARRDAQLSGACPAGSRVLVWGWAPELYVEYAWINQIPYMNVTQLTYAQANYASGLEVIRKAVEDPATDCVVDAVGLPFFDAAEQKSLTAYYPQIVPVLDAGYRSVGRVLGCEACTVYVRR